MSYPSYENQYHRDVQVGDKTIKFTVGKFSEQVSAAVLAQCGETVVHTTVALGHQVNLGYFPLSVEFEEKLYSSGIIKGSRWVKREGRRPMMRFSEQELLIGLCVLYFPKVLNMKYKLSIRCCHMMVKMNQT